MSRTLIIIDPMGFNLMSLGMQYLLFKGTLVKPGDTVYRLPYTNQAGASNIAGGVTALNTKLNSTSGDIMVFGYSEGAQVATKWLRDYGISSPVTPTSRLSFLLIGNAERRYGGFAYKHDNLAAICDVDGLPDPLSDGTSTVPYAVTDFARQYDGFADFPSASDIQQAVDSVGAALSDPLNWALRALQDVTNAVIGAHKDAAVNAVLGMQMVHTNYFTVTPDDRHNVRFTDPDHPSVEYVWAPTYPVPLLGIGSTFPSLDRDKRKAIETAYSRPVVMPAPNYPQISMFTTDFFGSDDDYRRVDETGWFPEPGPISAHFTLSLNASLGMQSVNQRGLSLSLTAHLSAAAIGRAGTSTATFGLTLTASMSMTGSPKAQAAFGLSLTAGMDMSASGRSVAAFGLSLSPELSLSAAEHYVRAFALALSPLLSMDGAGTSLAAFGLSLTASMGMEAQGRSVAEFGLSLTPGVVMTPNLRSSFTLHGSPSLSVAAIAVYTRAFSLALSSAMSMAATGTSVAQFGLSLSASMSVVGSGKSVAAFGLSATPGLSVAATGHGGSFGRSFGLSLTPALSMTAAGHGGTFTRTLGLSLIASLGMAGTGNDGGPAATIYIGEYTAGDVLKWDGSSLTLFLDNVAGTRGIAFDSSDDLYLNFSGASGTVQRWNGSTLTTVVSGLPYSSGIAINPANDDLFICYTTHVDHWNGSSSTTVIDGLSGIFGIGFGPSGDLYVCDSNGSIQKWDGTSLSSVGSAGLTGVRNFAVDNTTGDFYLCTSTEVFAWSPGGSATSIVSGLTGYAYGLTVGPP